MKHARADYDPIQDPRGLIPEDEPVFLLRAQDAASVDTVQFWASRAESLGASPEIVKLAREHAIKMRVWQGRLQAGPKVPDLPIPAE